jgi:hypothetical protein
MGRSALLLSVVLNLAWAGLAGAADGDPDIAFGPNHDGRLLYGGAEGYSVRDMVATDNRVYTIGDSYSTPTRGIYFIGLNAAGNLVDICLTATAATFPSFESSQAESAILTSDGKLLVAGEARIFGGSGTLTPVVARFDLSQSGCVLDTSFAGVGWVALPQIVTCATQDCFGRDLVEMPAPVAGSPRYVLLEQADDGARTFALVGLAENGSLQGSFGSGGSVEISVPGVSDYDNSAGRVAADTQGRIYAAVTHRDPAQSTDRDLALLCYTVAGTLDTGFGGGDGMVRWGESPDSEDTYLQALTVDPRRIVLIAYSNSDASASVIQGFDHEGGHAVQATVPGAVLALAASGEGKLLVAAKIQNLDETGVGRLTIDFGNHTLEGDVAFGQFGWTFYDFDVGTSTVDSPHAIAQMSGRPVVAGDANAGAGILNGYLVRLTNDYVFADGFENASTWSW